jgi:hypothetical protein
MRKTIITAGLAAALATTGFVGTAAANPLLLPIIAGAVVGGAAVGTAAADDYGPTYSDEATSSYTYVQPAPSYTYVQPQPSYTYVQPSVTYQRTYTPTYRTYTTAYSSTSHTAWCEAHYRSYNPSTDSFISYSGVEMRCVSPYG